MDDPIQQMDLRLRTHRNSILLILKAAESHQLVCSIQTVRAQIPTVITTALNLVSFLGFMFLLQSNQRRTIKSNTKNHQAESDKMEWMITFQVVVQIFQMMKVHRPHRQLGAQLVLVLSLIKGDIIICIFTEKMRNILVKRLLLRDQVREEVPALTFEKRLIKC